MEKKSYDFASERIYDEFEPIARWTSEPGFETLTVYLPGFKKEQLKVQVTSTRKLRVMGERPAGGNKWIRFRKEYPIQSNIDVDVISAKFEGVNLIVKLPRPEPKGKQQPSGNGAANPPRFNPPVHQLPKPAEKEEASRGAEKAKEPLRPPMEKPAEKEEASKGAEKVHPPKPAMEKQFGKEPATEKRAVKEEAPKGAEKVHPPKRANEKQSEKESETEKRAEKEEASRDAEMIKEKEKPNDGIQGTCCKVGGYKNVLRGYLREMKNNKRAMLVGLVVVASIFVLSLGIYAGKRLRSSFGG